MHKLNLKLELVDAASPGLQSKLALEEHQQRTSGRMGVGRHYVIIITPQAPLLDVSKQDLNRSE